MGFRTPWETDYYRGPCSKHKGLYIGDSAISSDSVLCKVTAILSPALTVSVPL